MSIGNVNGVGPVASLQQNDPRTSAGAGTPAPRKDAPRTSSSGSSPQIDEVTMQPKPPRFPWLSRLSQQLESAAQQRPSFPEAPALGDNLDQTA